MENNTLCKLTDEQVAAIIDFTKSKKKDIDNVSFNRVLRDDIFPLLEDQCIVIYFPKENERNNGFNVQFCINGKLEYFVYINTAQHREKQIFTAAHELGHIWDLWSYLENRGLVSEKDNKEYIINRFAAELLMPEAEFKVFFNKIFKEICRPHEISKITIGTMIHIITAIMNEFLTPYKSVVYRLFELEIIHKNSVEVLLHDYEAVERLSKAIAREQGYNRVYQPPSMLKWIDGLKELLDQAKKQELMPNRWIESFSQLFDFDETSQNDEFKASFPEKIVMGGDTVA